MQRARSPRIADERRRCKAEAQVLIVYVPDATRPLLSVSRTVKENDPALVGVPEIVALAPYHGL
jgi:hypothetical protein